MSVYVDILSTTEILRRCQVVPIGGTGWVARRFDHELTVAFQRAGGGEEVNVEGWNCGAKAVLWLDPGMGRALVFQWYGRWAVWVELDSGKSRRFSVFPDADPRETEFEWIIDTESGPVISCDGGLMAVGLDGAIRWSKPNRSQSIYETRQSGTELLCDDQFGRRWTYRIDDGTRSIIEDRPFIEEDAEPFDLMAPP